MIFPTSEKLSDIEYCIQSLKNLKGISIASLNICHLLPKLDDIRILLERSNLDILCLNETFLDDDIADAELNIPQYNFIRADRTIESGKSTGGGIIIYYKSSRDVKLIENSIKCTPSLECCWLELSLKQSRKTIIGRIYRAPNSNLSNSISELEEIMNVCDISPVVDVVICGDFNVDLMKNNAQTKNLHKFLTSKCSRSGYNFPHSHNR